VERPGTHLNPQANVHSDPVVRSSKSSLSGEVVAQEANTKVKEINSAPSIFWHESEQGDQLHQRVVRYNGARNLGLEERNVDRNKAEATNDEVTVVPETSEHEVRRASKLLFSDSMSDVANISISPDSAFVSQSVEPDNAAVDSEQSEYYTANKTVVPQPSLR